MDGYDRVCHEEHQLHSGQHEGYLDQGANDYLAQDERNSVLSVLKQYVSSVFEDEANADYSGREPVGPVIVRTHHFCLMNRLKNLAYDIKENFKYRHIGRVNVVTGMVEYKKGADAQNYADQMAAIEKKSFYKVQLAYKNCSAASYASVKDGKDAAENYVTLTTSYKGTDGTDVEKVYKSVTRASTDANAYEVGDDEVIYLYDTGEMLIGKNVYTEIQENQADFRANYCKTEFDKSDIRPEMYFECQSYNKVSKKETTYADPDGQEYQV